MIKRFIAVTVAVAGLTYALGRVYRDGWHRGWVHALDLISWENEYVPDYGELPY